MSMLVGHFVLFRSSHDPSLIMGYGVYSEREPVHSLGYTPEWVTSARAQIIGDSPGAKQAALDAVVADIVDQINTDSRFVNLRQQLATWKRPLQRMPLEIVNDRELRDALFHR